ncbi:IGHMBP2 family helicase [Methanobrevibacter sp. DSM 116169]|uniref:IGHMBP2 family helicase n=1 Tax=Methanobrevibacter sp. DSM 116169 TaxID=3242727 RepID=UPI0038FBFE4C
MKNYIKYLIKLLEYERKAEIDLMINEIKKMSPQKREHLGRAVNNLKGKIVGKELGFTIVQYGRRDIINTEISVGDVVLISFKNPLKSDLTGTVTEKGGRFIKIAMENVPSWALKKNIRMDLYVSDITFRRMEDNLKNLSEFGKNALKYLNDNVKFQNPKNISLIFKDKNLNESQKEAVNDSLNINDFFLIHGPFGTGKTRTLIELIYQEYLKGSKILACADSNGAVDNILERLDIDNLNCTRLGHPQRVSDENIKYSLFYKVENHPLNSKIVTLQEKLSEKIKLRDINDKPRPQNRRGYSNNEIIKNACQGIGGRGIRPDTMISMSKWLEANEAVDELNKKIKLIEDKIISDIIKNSDIILATNSSAALEFIDEIRFDVAIIDEASQSTIPSVLIPIAKARKFILAGDHKQLPPTVISSKAQDLQNTLFEGLINKYENRSKLLNIQYRMNDKLMEFPNKEFYNNELKSFDGVKNISLNDLVKNDYNEPILFIDTSKIPENKESHLKDSKSIINKVEANIVKEIIGYILNLAIDSKDIGVISPYLDQVNLIKSKINLDVKTIDGFQGREKEIIIISLVRSNNKGNLGFLKDLRRLNVSLTRAKRKLIIIGNSKTLESDDTYKRLIDFFKINESFCVHK